MQTKKTPKTSVTAQLHHRADTKGQQTLIVQVIHARRRSIVSTPYRLHPKEFDPETGQAVTRSRNPQRHDLVREANACLDTTIRSLQGVIRRLDETGRPYTASDVTEAYRCENDRRNITTFARKLIEELEGAGHFGTARSYRSMLSAWEKFCGRTDFRFYQLDSRTLAAFVEHLEHRENKRNTVAFYLRTLRALYNRARREGYAPQENPFREISFRQAETPKLAVGRELLKRLAGTDFRDETLNEARDIFLFSFYARGMSFVDMAYLRKEKIWDGALHYERTKTHQAFSVGITPQMREILKRYCDPGSPWALPCMKRGLYLAEGGKDNRMADDIGPAALYRLYNRSLQYYIGLLDEISGRLGCRKLTFNTARHTWATLARNMGIPVSYISEGLGHTSERTTRIYMARLDSSTVDKVNEKVTRL